MVMATDLKRKICSLFEVVDDEKGVQRIVMPIEYPSTGDKVVIRVRPRENGAFRIDEAGDASLYASMAGGDTECDSVQRWMEEAQELSSPVRYEDDTLVADALSQDLVAPYIFRVAEAAQQLFAISTSRAIRQASDFKNRLSEVIATASEELHFSYQADVELPIAGGLHADFLVPGERPLIVIAANSLPRLLEAEIIHMQYQLSNRPGFVLAVAESQASVGKKQFERANYYTDKTVSFNALDLRQFLSHTLAIPN